MVSPSGVSEFPRWPAREQRIVAALALVHEPVGQRALSEWLKLLPLGERVRGMPEGEALSELLETLALDTGVQAMGAAHARKYTVSVELAHAALSWLREEKLLDSASAYVTRRAPRRDQETAWLHRSRVVRDVVLACHGGDSAAVQDSLDDAARDDSLGDEPSQILFDALGVAPPAHAVSGLSPEQRDLYVLRAIAEALETLSPLGDDLNALLHARAADLPPPVLAALGFYDAVRGDASLADALAAHEDSAEVVATRAFAALTRGDIREARALARSAYQLSRGAHGRKKGGVTGHAGPWLALLLLTARDPEAMADAESQLEAAERRPELFHHAEAYATVRVLATYLKKSALPPARGEAFDDFSESETAWERALLWDFLSSSTGGSPPRGYAAALSNCEAHAQACGFAWLAAELARAREGHDAGLRALHVQQEPWEQQLASFELALTQHEVSELSQPKARLRFLLQVDRRGRHNVSARIERLGPSGYTVGRPIGWKRLRDIALASDWLDADDLRVLRHVREAEAEAGASSREWALDEQGLAALVRHPRVYANESAVMPLEVVQGVPRLEVLESPEGLRLRVVPSALGERRVVCAAEGKQRVRVYVLSDAQWAVTSQCGTAGLLLPLRARERLSSVRNALARHFEVHSEVQFEGVPAEVPADERLHVQLVRTAHGFRMRVRVTPLLLGPSFVPGEGPLEVLAICSRPGGPRAERTRRDLDAERARAEALVSACESLRHASREGFDFQIHELAHCLELLQELHNLGDAIVVEWPEGQPLSVVAERDLGDLRLALKQAAYWLSADGGLPVDAGLTLSLRQLLEGLSKAEGRFLALSEGRFLALTQRLKRELEDLSVLSQVRDGELALHPLSLGVLDGWGEALAQVSLDERVSLSLTRVREAAQLEVELPDGLAAELRPYQREGFVWLSRLAHMGAGACLADDMGLGKTLQALALLAAHRDKGPSLVVAPTSVTGNWVDETARFAPGLRVVRFVGETRDKLVRELGPGDLLVCSYGMLQQGIELLEGREFAVVVLDEAQAIKNPGTQRAKTAMRLKANMRVALTGTPVENHLGELWSIMSFLNPGLLGSMRSFEQRFARPIQRGEDWGISESLRRVVHPFILRRKKSDVLSELPEKTVVTLRITPSPEERALYAALREQALARLRDPGRPGEVRLRMLAELMRMRRAACHPNLVTPEANLESSKLEAFEELVHELRDEGHRALVFSQFVDHLSIVRKRLDDLGVSYQYLDGSTSPAQRTERVRAFQAGEGDVFLISLRAGGFGLNLTAADYVIHLDPWWNPAVEDQASDRAHRIGQTRPVTIYRLVMEGSIEEKILALHDEKRELADRLLEGSDLGATLNIEALTALIRDMGTPEPSEPLYEAGA